jgi:hypothetical protein
MIDTHKRYRAWLVSFVILSVLGRGNRLIQAYNDTTCVCQPTEITFTVNKTLSCDTNTIVAGLPGIENAQCVVTTEGNSSPDTVPISISMITVSEVDSLKNVLLSVTYIQAIFTYTSYAVTESESVANGVIPKGLQISTTGLNAAGETIINNVEILFTNECKITPVLEGGGQIGWTSLVRIYRITAGNLSRHIDFAYICSIEYRLVPFSGKS